MAGLPTVQVQLDDANNGNTWPYDITAYARLLYDITTRGAADENAAPAPVTASLRLDNTDGRFTLGSSSGGYGVINLNRGIRVRVTANAVTTTRFTGFVQSWPTSWPSGSDLLAVTDVSAVDAMARWNRRELRSVGEEEARRLGAVMVYPLNEPSGAVQAIDTVGGNKPLMVQQPSWFSGTSDVVFGSATGPGSDGYTAAQFANGKILVAGQKDAASNDAVTYACTFLSKTSPDLDTARIWGPFTIKVGENVVRVGTTVSSPYILDNATHSLIFTKSATTAYTLYLDGVNVSSGAGPQFLPAEYVVGYAFTGTVAYATRINRELTSTEVGTLHSALMTGFPGERSDLRVSRLMQYEGTVSTMVGDTGQTFMPAAKLAGVNAGDAIQQVAAAEQGFAYTDGQGRLAFHNRNRDALKVTPTLVLSCTTDVLSPDTQVLADSQQLVNYASGKRLNVNSAPTQVVENAKSRLIHGRYSASQDYLVQTDEEVLQRLQWLVTTHATPGPRVSELRLDLLSQDAKTQADILALDIDDRLQITDIPAQGYAGTTTLDVAIVGYSENLTADSWTWTANVISWPDLVQAAVLNDATYGKLDNSLRLGV